MHKSEHVKERQQQRCIDNDAINLVLRYGKVLRRVGGCETLGFPRKLKPFIEKENLKNKNVANVFAVVNRKADMIITVGYRTKF
mgnify:FL=1|jgi:hypothetical protein